MAHLLRHGAQPPRARCGLEAGLSTGIEYPAAPECAVCAQLQRLDVLGEAIGSLIASPASDLTGAQAEAIRDWLANRTSPDG